MSFSSHPPHQSLVWLRASYSCGCLWTVVINIQLSTAADRLKKPSCHYHMPHTCRSSSSASTLYSLPIASHPGNCVTSPVPSVPPRPPVPSRPVPSRPVPSLPVPSRPVPSRPVCPVPSRPAPPPSRPVYLPPPRRHASALPCRLHHPVVASVTDKRPPAASHGAALGTREGGVITRAHLRPACRHPAPTPAPRTLPHAIPRRGWHSATTDRRRRRWNGDGDGGTHRMSSSL